jgi:hypothetical protein
MENPTKERLDLHFAQGREKPPQEKRLCIWPAKLNRLNDNFINRNRQGLHH